MAMQTASNGGNVYIWREPNEEYLEDCVPDFKRVKIWSAIQYGKRTKLIVILEY